jgi:hypothetical protein
MFDAIGFERVKEVGNKNARRAVYFRIRIYRRFH